jgi:thymidine phosphorylase
MADVTATSPGFVSEIDTRGLGFAVVELGGGRRKASDAIDPAVGLEGLVGLGAAIEPGEPLARVHAADEAAFKAAEGRIRTAYRITDAPPPENPLIVERIA